MERDLQQKFSFLIQRTPYCSVNYAKIIQEKFGEIKGVLTTTANELKCQPNKCSSAAAAAKSVSKFKDVVDGINKHHAGLSQKTYKRTESEIRKGEFPHCTDDILQTYLEMYSLLQRYWQGLKMVMPSNQSDAPSFEPIEAPSGQPSSFS